jgi:hypothetical protein
VVFTTDAVYVVTTAKKGLLNSKQGKLKRGADVAIPFFLLTAKHLEPLKGGKIPLEVLVRGKDAEQNAKHFEKCLEVIKSSGVSLNLDVACQISYSVAEKGGNPAQSRSNRTICGRVEKGL